MNESSGHEESECKIIVLIQRRTDISVSGTGTVNRNLWGSDVSYIDLDLTLATRILERKKSMFNSLPVMAVHGLPQINIMTTYSNSSQGVLSFKYHQD